MFWLFSIPRLRGWRWKIQESVPVFNFCLFFQISLVCFLVLAILNKAWTRAKKAFFLLPILHQKVLMQWSSGLASLLWVWQFPHHLLPFSFFRTYFITFWDDFYEFHCSSLWYNTSYWSRWVSFQVCVLLKGCSLGFLCFSILPFGFFSLLPRMAFYSRMEYYYVLLLVFGVFPAPFISCINYRSLRIFYPGFFFSTGSITNIHFNLLPPTLIILEVCHLLFVDLGAASYLAAWLLNSLPQVHPLDRPLVRCFCPWNW